MYKRVKYKHTSEILLHDLGICRNCRTKKMSAHKREKRVSTKLICISEVSLYI